VAYDPAYHLPRIRRVRRSDAYLRLKEALNRKLRRAYHGCGDDTAVAFIGCTSKEFRVHLRTQFTRGMSHKNYGTVWHIDHVKPCASFDLNSKKERAACYHVSNLAPRFAFDNISKKDK
jgi:hypothetical protein